MKECMQDMLFQKKVLEDELEPVKLHNEALLLDVQDAAKRRRLQGARMTSKHLVSTLNSCVCKPCMFARVSEVNPPPPPRPPADASRLTEANSPPPPRPPADGGAKGSRVGSWQHHQGGWKPKSVAMAGGALQHSCMHGLHSCHVNTMHGLHSCAWLYSCHVNTCMYMGCIHVNTRPSRLESPCLEASC